LIHTLVFTGALQVPPFFATVAMMGTETQSYKELQKRFPGLTPDRAAGILLSVSNKMKVEMRVVEEMLCCLAKDKRKRDLKVEPYSIEQKYRYATKHEFLQLAPDSDIPTKLVISPRSTLFPRDVTSDEYKWWLLCSAFDHNITADLLSLKSRTAKLNTLCIAVRANKEERAVLPDVKTRKCRAILSAAQVLTNGKKKNPTPKGLIADKSVTNNYKLVFQLSCTIWSPCQVTEVDIAKAIAKKEARAKKALAKKNKHDCIADYAISPHQSTSPQAMIASPTDECLHSINTASDHELEIIEPSTSTSFQETDSHIARRKRHWSNYTDQRSRRIFGEIKNGIVDIPYRRHNTRSESIDCVPTVKEIIDVGSQNESRTVLYISLYSVMQNELSHYFVRQKVVAKQTSTVVIDDVSDQSSCIDVSVNTEKVNGRLMWYASYKTTSQLYRNLLPKQLMSLSIGFKGHHQKSDHTFLFCRADHARTYLYMSVLIEMFPFLFHSWLGSQRFVIIRRPGDTCAHSVLFVIFRYKNQVWVGHTNDKLYKRTMIPFPFLPRN
jgi:hypothetical protein